jgi:hypothetical protein
MKAWPVKNDVGNVRNDRLDLLEQLSSLSHYADERGQRNWDHNSHVPKPAPFEYAVATSDVGRKMERLMVTALILTLDHWLERTGLVVHVP